MRGDAVTGDEYTQVADDALNAVLAETDESANPAPDEGTSPAAPPQDGTVEATTATSEPLCDEDQARDLVSQVRSALEQFDNAIQAIIRLRAWEPLGYDNPRDFVLAEFGPTDDPDASGRVSRVHAYRLARLAMFMYGLSTRIGDEAAAVELSERALRSLPSGTGGENDLEVLERVESRVADLGHDPSPDEAQQLLDEELTKARAEIADGGSLGGSAADGDDTDVLDPDRLASLGIDPESLTGDTEPSSAAGDAATTAADGPAPAEHSEPEQQGASRNDLAAAYGAPAEGGGEALEKTQHLAALTRSLQQVAEVEELLPGLIDYADDTEIEALGEMAASTVRVAQSLVEAARERSEEMLADPGAL